MRKSHIFLNLVALLILIVLASNYPNAFAITVASKTVNSQKITGTPKNSDNLKAKGKLILKAELTNKDFKLGEPI